MPNWSFSCRYFWDVPVCKKDWIKNFSRLLVLSCAFNYRIPLYVWTASIDIYTSSVAKTWNGKWHRKWDGIRNRKRNETNKGKSNAISNIIKLTDVLIIAKTIYNMYFLNIFYLKRTWSTRLIFKAKFLSLV